MPDTSPLDALGQQLTDFLTAQFVPPPGTRTVLAFFGGGVAVRPKSFLSQGQYNPALVNDWLNTLVDRVVPVSGGRAAATLLTANALMRTVANIATIDAPDGSKAANDFIGARSKAANAVGFGRNNVDAAPLDWYDDDPAAVASWPAFSKSATSGAGSEVEPQPDSEGLLWSWRKLPSVEDVVGAQPDGALPHPLVLDVSPALIARVSAQPEAAVAAAPGSDPDAAPTASMAAPSPPARTAMVASAQPMAMHFMAVPDRESVDDDGVDTAEVETQPAEAADAAVVPAPSSSASTSAAAPATAADVPLSATQTPILVAPINILSVAAEQAETSHVEASSLTLSLSYLLVELSRSAWWDDVLVDQEKGWYFPGERRGSLVPGNLATDQSIGIPVALVLTENVQVEGTWSKNDRQTATSATHFGPWSLGTTTTSAFEGSTSGARLTIPGMQAIGCIYRLLPVLPPSDDPKFSAGRHSSRGVGEE